MIDLSAPPFNVRGDWNGSDATATNNTNAIKDAIAAAHASNTGFHPDYGGTWGDTLLFPKGSVMVDDTLVLGDGVALQGSGDYATTLVMKASFDPNKHFVILGSPGDNLSSFGGKIRNMNLWAPSTNEAISTAAMVFTNDAQDGTILDHVRIYGFQRRCFWGEIGYGGASIIRMLQVTGNTSAPNRAAFYFNYGESTMIYVEGIETSGARINPNDENSPQVPGTFGIVLNGGFAKFTRVHPELQDYPFYIDMKSSKCFCDIDFMTGGPFTKDLITIAGNPLQQGRVRLSNIIRNGATGHIVANSQNGAGPIDNEIVDPIRL
jgi:hypothetical protein